MNAATAISIIIIFLAVFFAIRYIVREKRKGNKCIGCPYAESCQKLQQIKQQEKKQENDQ